MQATPIQSLFCFENSPPALTLSAVGEAVKVYNANFSSFLNFHYIVLLELSRTDHGKV